MHKFKKLPKLFKDEKVSPAQIFIDVHDLGRKITLHSNFNEFLGHMMNKVGLKGDISSGLDNGISQQSQVLNEIQSELASIIDIQDTDINEINETMESTGEITSKATQELETASGRKFTLRPLFIVGNSIFTS